MLHAAAAVQQASDRLPRESKSGLLASAPAAVVTAGQACAASIWVDAGRKERILSNLQDNTAEACCHPLSPRGWCSFDGETARGDSDARQHGYCEHWSTGSEAAT